MNTPETARVEVTPELLDSLAEKAAAPARFPYGSLGYDRARHALSAATPPAVTLALVERIRELESEVVRIDATNEEEQELSDYDPWEIV